EAVKMAFKNQALLLLVTALCACSVPLAEAASSLRRRHGGGSDKHDRDDLDCFASGVDDWDAKLHIAGIFIILVASGIGSFLPVLGYYVPWLRIPRSALTLGKFLGT
ncbi:hypothetical protein IWW38_006390, partial [Coemansia aciculifera]